jgi:TonB family protein
MRRRAAKCHGCEPAKLARFKRTAPSGKPTRVEHHRALARFWLDTTSRPAETHFLGEVAMRDVAANEVRPAEFVTVTALFGDTVLDTRELRPAGGAPAEYLIGEDARATAPARGLGVPLFSLARMTGGGCRVAWCHGMTGEVVRGDRHDTLDALVERGETEPQPMGHAFWLPHGAACRVVAGETVFWIQSSTPPERVATPPLRLADRDLLASDGISAAAHAVVLFLVFSVPPSSVNGGVLPPLTVVSATFRQRPPPLDQAPDWMNRPRPDPRPQPTHAGPRSRSPRRTEAPRALPRGDGESAADLARRAVKDMGVLRFLTDPGGNLSRVFSRDDSALGQDAEEALSDLQGDRLQAGFDLSGVAITPLGGGREGGGIRYGTYRTGPGGPEGGPGGGPPGRLRKHQTAVPDRIGIGIPVVRGALDREIIRRVVRRNTNQIRYCYELGLRGRAGSSGRVNVQFLIGANGAVLSSRIQSSDLGDAAAEQCIADAVRRWAFPAPAGGGTVLVNYPFLLRATGE